MTHRRAIKEETIAINMIGFTNRHADCRMLSKLHPKLVNEYDQEITQ